MTILSHVSIETINNLPPPPHSLRRCWNPSYLEDMSIIEYNRKYLVKQLRNIFNHVNEIKFNKYIHHQYRCALNYIFIRVGKHYKDILINNILSYISDVNQTSINRIMIPNIFYID